MAAAIEAKTLALRHWRIQIEIPSDVTGSDLCMVEHTLDPGYLAMPLRRNLNASVIFQPVRGTVSLQLEEEVVRAKPGDSVLVPRGARHTFWNSSDSQVEFREISAPGGLDRYYEALAPLIPVGGRADVDGVFALSAPHGLEFDLDSLLDLIERHRVHLV